MKGRPGTIALFPCAVIAPGVLVIGLWALTRWLGRLLVLVALLAGMGALLLQARTPG